MKQLDFLDALNEIPEEFRDELTQWQKAGTPLSEEIPEQHTAEDAEPVVPVKEEIVMKTQKDREIPTKWLKPVTIGVFASIAACLAAVIYFGGKASQKDQQPDRTPAAQISEQTEATTPIVQTVVMPEVIGLDHHQATEAMGLAGYRGGSQDSVSCKIVEQDMPDLPPGVVIACDPPVGETIPEGKEATLTVVARRSFEGESDSVVWFLDTEYDKFCKYADQMGVGIRKHEVPNDHPEEHDGKAAYVTSYCISKADVESGSCYVMNVTVATENVQDDSVRLPDLIGKDYQQADQIAKQLGLNLEWRKEETTAPAGTVIAVEGADGVLHEGDTVTLTVSAEQGSLPKPGEIVVPNCISMNADSVKDTAERLGLQEIKFISSNDSLPVNPDEIDLSRYLVVAQSLTPGDSVSSDTVLTLTIMPEKEAFCAMIKTMRVSTPILRDQNTWLECTTEQKEKYAELVYKMELTDAPESQFDFDGGGLLVEMIGTDGRCLMLELFNNGLVKEIELENSKTVNTVYTRDKSDSAASLLKLVQDQIVTAYPE